LVELVDSARFRRFYEEEYVSDREEHDKPSGLSRAEFVKRLAFGAFAVPAISSFKLDSLARYPGQSQGNQTYGNQTYGNQTYPNQSCPNQTVPGGPAPVGGTPDQRKVVGLIFRFLRLGRGF
jgi:hypothetical protein